ncbi:MAG: CpaF family protein, partial [Gemmatimonadota bacterium]
LDEQAYAGRLIAEALHDHASACISAGQEVPSVEEEAGVAAAVHALLYTSGRLQALLDDPRPIINIFINGPDDTKIELLDGTILPGPSVAESNDELADMVRELARRFGFSERQFDYAHPEINLTLTGGSRLFAIGWVCAGVNITIARNRRQHRSVADLVSMGILDRGMGELLAAAVRSGFRICIAGGMGVGKTTSIQGLASEISRSERIVTVETDYELALDAFPDVHDNVVALEARPPNSEGRGEVTCADLVRSAQRMRAARLIVGEVRHHEIIPMLNAMNSGAPGLFSVHSSSSEAVLNKLALLAMQAPENLSYETTNRMVADAIDLIVYLAPRPNAKGGHVASIREVAGIGDGNQVATNEIYRPGPDGRGVPDAPLTARSLTRLAAAGFDPAVLDRRDGWWA